MSPEILGIGFTYKSNFLTDIIMKIYFCLILFITISSSLSLPKGGVLSNGGKIWALLVAGSNGYYNYRHQVSNIIIFIYL